MNNLHIKIAYKQSSYGASMVCGDAVEILRCADYTLLVLCDGVGHGIQAHLNAQMIAARIKTLAAGGMSLRRISTKLTSLAEGDEIQAFFSIIKIKTNGETTLITCDMPGGILIHAKQASLTESRKISDDPVPVYETTLSLSDQDAILLVSDGITQSGMGTSMRTNWGIEGVLRYLQKNITAKTACEALPTMVIAGSMEVSGNGRHDDKTACVLECVEAQTVTILTGPPKDKKKDTRVVRSFMKRWGTKVICGAETANIAARVLNRKLEEITRLESKIAPPAYTLAGVDLVTEGAVTLNQVYNILDTPVHKLEQDTGVTNLALKLRSSDRVCFMVGQAENPAHRDISFTQRGILPRLKIIELLKKKLEEAGKLVIIEYI